MYERNISVAGHAEAIAREIHAGHAYHGTQDHYRRDFIDFHLLPGVRIIRGLGGSDVEEAIFWLHDAVEDTDTTLDDLKRRGVPPSVISGVDLLTVWPGLSHEEYMARLAAKPRVSGLKIVDSRVNLDATFELEPFMSAKDYDACVRKYAGNIILLAPGFTVATDKEPWARFAIEQTGYAQTKLDEHAKRFGQTALSLATNLPTPALEL